MTSFGVTEDTSTITMLKKNLFCLNANLNRSLNLIAAEKDMVDGTGDCGTGRRIKCDSLLILADLTNEIKYGLAFYFVVKCRQCLLNRIISTGEKHVVPQGERSRCFDINTKMAAGKYDYY